MALAPSRALGERAEARPQRVLMTADAVGGVWTYALDLAGILAACGVDVDLATMGPPPSEAQIREAHATPGLTLHVSRWKLEWMPEPWEDVDRAGDWLLELETRLRPDIVHLNGYCHAHLPFRAPVLAVCHSDVLSWWQAVKGEPVPPEWAEYARRVRAGLAGADLVVAPTKAMLREAERYYGPFGASRTVYNGRPSAPQSPVPSEAPFIFAAGRAWDEAKNLRLLAQIAPRLPWPVRIAGDFGEAPPPGVEALGHVAPPTIQEHYARADVFAHPARYEPFGLAVLEAARAETALVLGDIPSLRELWADAALFVPPNDPDALTQALHELIDDPHRRQSLAQKARERAGRYTLERMAGGYLDSYTELMEVNAA